MKMLSKHFHFSAKKQSQTLLTFDLPVDHEKNMICFNIFFIEIKNLGCIGQEIWLTDL